MLHVPYAIPLVACLAFVIILFFGTKLPRRGSDIGIASMAISVVLAIILNVQWVMSNGQTVIVEHRWFEYGDTTITAGTMVDGLTAIMLLVVTVISLLVQIFSASYMRSDSRYTHFFAVLTLFSAAMEWFVMSANTLQMIFGWEVMALCSFLLIGHWWEEKHNVNAALKAFLTTRASDIGLFVGVAVLFFTAGQTFDITALNELASSGQLAEGALTAGCIALFIAVIGKSAQFPLHTWLPDAMAGPTPMSALIHAATMVVAGVFLLARLFPTFDSAFEIIPGGWTAYAPLSDGAYASGTFGGGVNVIAVIGAITIVIAGLLALVQRDIKKVLSYSTVSQLGYMVMAIGVGGVMAAMLHLFVHAFAKALLFLTSGSLSHAVHGFDLERDMGKLRKDLPLTHASFAVGALTLIGIIPFAGFWSKEQIAATAHSNGYEFFFWVSLVGSVLTAAYMCRTYYLAFWGDRRGPSVVREAPRAMTWTCLALAAMTIASAFVALPMFGYDPFASWLFPNVVPTVEFTWLGIALEVLFPVVGLAVAGFAFAKGIGPRTLARRSSFARAVYALLNQRYYLDWLYEHLFVKGIKKGLAWVVHWVDHNVIDNGVDAVGKASLQSARVILFLDDRAVDGVVNRTSAGAYNAGGVLDRSQSGQIQRYVATIIVSVALITGAILVWG